MTQAQNTAPTAECYITVDGEQLIRGYYTRAAAHALYTEALAQPELRNAGTATSFALFIYKVRHRRAGIASGFLRERSDLFGGAR